MTTPDSLPPPPPPPSIAPPPSRSASPPAPVVQVVQRATGLGRLTLAFMLALLLLGSVAVIAFFGGALMGGVVGASIEAAGADRGVLATQYRPGTSSSTIAILPVEGGIDGAMSSFVRAAVDTILDDDRVEAVVLRVNSGGGGVTASDQIWNEVGRLKASGRPVVASFGGVAASGGYYVAVDADHIMAEVTCTTGSIGVIAQILTVDGLMNLAGIEPVTLVAQGSPRKAVANDPFRAWNEDDRAAVLARLDDAYATFNQRVRDGRSTVIPDPARIDTLADGSVYSAREALDHGLIDAIGYLDDAIAEAERRAGIAAGTARIRRLGRMPSLFGGLPLLEAPKTGLGGLDAERVRGFVNELSQVRLMYLGRMGG